MLHTLQDRISHLEDQLSEATLQLNLSGSQPVSGFDILYCVILYNVESC